MKYLLSVCALFALLAVGCGEDAVVDSGGPSAPAPYSGPPGDVMEVDSDALTSTLKKLKPGLQMMAGEFDGQVKIVAVDVDNSGDVAKEYGVTGMPTLVLMRGDEEVSRMSGADETKIRQMMQDAL